MTAGRLAPSLDDIERLARAALADIPEPLLAKVAEVAIHVVDFPDEETLTEMAMDSPWDLTGLYRGTPLTERSVSGDHGRLPDTVHLYRQPILAEWCESGETLEDIVYDVVIHEIGHHFGFSDDDIDYLQSDEAE